MATTAAPGHSGALGALPADSFMKQVVAAPEAFFTASEDLAQACRQMVKTSFDTSVATWKMKGAHRPKVSAGQMLPELFIEGFDTEQIWEELALQSTVELKHLGKLVSKLMKEPEKVRLLNEDSRKRSRPEPEPQPKRKAVVMADSDEEDDEEDEDADDYDGEEPMGSDADSDAEHDDESEDDGAGGDATDEDDEDDDDAHGEYDADDADAEQKASGDEDEDENPVVSEDEFFNVDEMDRLMDEMEENNGDFGDDEETDEDEAQLIEQEFTYGGTSTDRSVKAAMKGPKYNDLFDDPNAPKTKSKAKRRTAAADDDDEKYADEDDDDEDGADLDMDMDDASDAEFDAETPYERNKKRMRTQIEQLEDEALGDRHWSMVGEAGSRERPQNSLLEAVVEYDRIAKDAPEITVERTVELETLIKRRILDEAWDDVVRKVPEKQAKPELAEVSQEKSKLGLGEVYEEAYKQAVMGQKAPDAKQKLRDEIDEEWRALCAKLDALSNFHFTPKLVLPEATIVADAPAITMEEVIPTAVSDAQLKAPEEVLANKMGRQGVLRGADELEPEDKQRLRRAKKQAKAKRRRQHEQERKAVERANPGLGNKHSKEKALREIAGSKNVISGKQTAESGSYSKSAKFFSKLQEQVSREVGGAKGGAAGSAAPSSRSATSFKL